MAQLIKIKKIHHDAELPFRGSQHAAGYDVKTIEESIIEPKKNALLKTGLAFEIPVNHYLLIAPRSSLMRKKTLYMPHSIGILDSDYRGELLIPLYNNHDSDEVKIEKGERIAQILLKKFEEMEFQVVDHLSETSRGTGGFGSTGMK